MKECAAVWRNMSAGEKAKYQSQNPKGDYERKYITYLSELPEERRNFEIDSNSKMSRKTYEKMLKTYDGNKNTTLKSSPTKNNVSNLKKEPVIKELPSKKAKKKVELPIKIPKATPKSISFAKFEEDDEEEKSPVFNSPSPVFETPTLKKKDGKKRTTSFSKIDDDDDDDANESIKVSPRKKASFLKFSDDVKESVKVSDSKDTPKKKASFLKFNDDANESVKVDASDDMPQPIPIKKETDKKRKNMDTSFPKPIKTEKSSDTEDSKPKKSKFVDESFDESIKHNSTKLESSPKKKKRVKQDSSSESESVLKPPK